MKQYTNEGKTVKVMLCLSMSQVEVSNVLIDSPVPMKACASLILATQWPMMPVFGRGYESKLAPLKTSMSVKKSPEPSVFSPP